MTKILGYTGTLLAAATAALSALPWEWAHIAGAATGAAAAVIAGTYTVTTQRALKSGARS